MIGYDVIGRLFKHCNISVNMNNVAIRFLSGIVQLHKPVSWTSYYLLVANFLSRKSNKNYLWLQYTVSHCTTSMVFGP